MCGVGWGGVGVCVGGWGVLVCVCCVGVCLWVCKGVCVSGYGGVYRYAYLLSYRHSDERPFLAKNNTCFRHLNTRINSTNCSKCFRSTGFAMFLFEPLCDRTLYFASNVEDVGLV